MIDFHQQSICCTTLYYKPIELNCCSMEEHELSCDETFDCGGFFVTEETVSLVVLVVFFLPRYREANNEVRFSSPMELGGTGFIDRFPIVFD